MNNEQRHLLCFDCCHTAWINDVFLNGIAYWVFEILEYTLSYKNLFSVDRNLWFYWKLKIKWFFFLFWFPKRNKQLCIDNKLIWIMPFVMLNTKQIRSNLQKIKFHSFRIIERWRNKLFRNNWIINAVTNPDTIMCWENTFYCLIKTYIKSI